MNAGPDGDTPAPPRLQRSWRSWVKPPGETVRSRGDKCGGEESAPSPARSRWRLAGRNGGVGTTTFAVSGERGGGRTSQRPGSRGHDADCPAREKGCCSRRADQSRVLAARQRSKARKIMMLRRLQSCATALGRNARPEACVCVRAREAWQEFQAYDPRCGPASGSGIRHGGSLASCGRIDKASHPAGGPRSKGLHGCSARSA